MNCPELQLRDHLTPKLKARGYSFNIQHYSIAPAGCFFKLRIRKISGVYQSESNKRLTIFRWLGVWVRIVSVGKGVAGSV